MAKIRCECHNYGECDIADNREIIEVESTEMECPECHKPLYEAGKKPTTGGGDGKKPLVIIAAAFIALVGVAVGGYSLGWYDSIFDKGGPVVVDPVPPDKEDSISQEEKPIQPEPVLAESVSIKENNFSLQKGQTKQLTIAVLPEENEDEVKITSSDESVATVTEEGLVKAVKAGTATITVLAEEADIQDDVIVTVTEPVVNPPQPQPSWGKYTGERNKSGQPDGQGVLTITRSHSINGEMAQPGETITGVFRNGYLNMGKWNKRDGNVVIVKDIKIL